MIKRKLEADSTLQQRTHLSPDDIADLLNLCLEKTDFIYNERHNTTNDSGPIGLSLMVTVSQMWMTHTMETAIDIAKSKNIATPEGLEVYMDDCWGYDLAFALTTPSPTRLRPSTSASTASTLG